LKRGIFDSGTWRSLATRARGEASGARKKVGKLRAATQLVSVTLTIGDLVNECLGLVTTARSNTFARDQLKEALATGSKEILGEAIRLAKSLRKEPLDTELDVAVQNARASFVDGWVPGEAERREESMRDTALLQEAIRERATDLSMDELLEALTAELR